MWQATKATGMIKSASMKAYEAPGCAFQVLQTGTPNQPSNAIRERGRTDTRPSLNHLQVHRFIGGERMRRNARQMVSEKMSKLITLGGLNG
jgi:hypothetical protein